MFVRLVKKPNNRVSVRIVENKRVDGKVKQKIISGIGTAHAEDQAKLEKLKRVAESLIVKLKNEELPALPGLEEVVHAKKESSPLKDSAQDLVSISNLKEESRLHRGVEDIFGAMFDQLNLFDSIDSGYKKQQSNNLFKEVVLNRIASPASKRKSVKNIERDKDISLDLDKVYRMMDKAYENQDRIKEKICAATTGLFKQKVDVAFFDVTTLYFESFIPDELRQSGYSKDGKFKETQVMLALITTTAGLPIGYELFPGNSYEGNTLMTVVEQVEKNYDLSDTFIVADRAMFTKKNLEKLEDKGVKFIVAAKLKTAKKEFKEKVLADVAEAKSNNTELETWSKDYDFEGRRLVVSYSSTRAAKDSNDRQRLIERIRKKMKNGKVAVADLINNTGTKKYLKIERKGDKNATLNQEKIEVDQQWDGIHGVVTNHTSDKISSLEILTRYRNLWQIEDAFRVNKHDLKMRPIFHWTPKRIKAHVLICFVTYALVAFVRQRLSEKNLNISFEQAREELNSLQASVITDRKTNQRFLLPSKITKNQRIIYSAFGLKISEAPILL
jgi:transposase